MRSSNSNGTVTDRTHQRGRAIDVKLAWVARRCAAEQLEDILNVSGDTFKNALFLSAFPMFVPSLSW
jgi:hypothetical protein